MKETLVFVRETRDGHKWHELAALRRKKLLAKNKLYRGRVRCAVFRMSSNSARVTWMHTRIHDEPLFLRQGRKRIGGYDA